MDVTEEKCSFTFFHKTCFTQYLSWHCTETSHKAHLRHVITEACLNVIPILNSYTSGRSVEKQSFTYNHRNAIVFKTANISL